MRALLLFIMMFASLAFADEVKIEINPPKPVMGEVFQAYFRIFTDSSEEPSVNFSPNSLEVVGKSNQGISTRSIYANGKLTVTREITVVYDLVAARAGTASMRDIVIQMGGKTVRHPTVNVNVLKEAEEIPSVFVMADVPKKSIFLGEGVTVRYYLYSKVPVSNLDVKKYPKLNSFLKRFLQEPDRSERVSVDGQLYLRNQIYAAKLFAEKVGKLKIDPLYLSATYAETRGGGNDPFSNFGFSREMKTRQINSESVDIEVKPLPENGKPANFTGLVGKHEFNIQFGQSKLIVNEPLEVKLTISGGGALENLEAPVVVSNPGLEEFESNGDLKIMDAENATKTFDYTFLAKENLKVPAKSVTLSYFDPDAMRYVPVQLNVPEIVVAGGQAGAAPKKEEKAPVEEKRNDQVLQQKVQAKVQEIAAPLLSTQKSWREWLPYLNLALAGLALVFAVGWVIKKDSLPQFHGSTQIPKSLKGASFNYSAFSKWISPLVQQTGKSPQAIIKESPLKAETKSYFIDILNSNDSQSYSTRKEQRAYSYKAGHFKELGRYIESAGHENTSKPS